jgi:hypothetical protein
MLKDLTKTATNVWDMMIPPHMYVHICIICVLKLAGFTNILWISFWYSLRKIHLNIICKHCRLSNSNILWTVGSNIIDCLCAELVHSCVKLLLFLVFHKWFFWQLLKIQVIYFVFSIKIFRTKLAFMKNCACLHKFSYFWSCCEFYGDYKPFETKSQPCCDRIICKCYFLWGISCLLIAKTSIVILLQP